MSEIILTNQNFEQEVINSKEPVLVDFWATWCGPCMRISPVLEKIAQDGIIKVGKVNVDEQMQLAIKYRVEVIPTLLFLKDGQIKVQKHGYMEEQEITSINKETPYDFRIAKNDIAGLSRQGGLHRFSPGL